MGWAGPNGMAAGPPLQVGAGTRGGGGCSSARTHAAFGMLLLACCFWHLHSSPSRGKYNVCVELVVICAAAVGCRCPNGHFYTIGNCGGAMQEATCAECGERIGGTSHTLRAGNQRADDLLQRMREARMT